MQRDTITEKELHDAVHKQQVVFDQELMHAREGKQGPTTDTRAAWHATRAHAHARMHAIRAHALTDK